MAELRAGGPTYSSRVRTARATPIWEHGGNPLSALAGEVASLAPLPSDFSDLFRAATTYRTPADYADTGVLPPSPRDSILEALRSMVRSAYEHPVATALPFVAPQAALGAYREMMPLPARAYLHSLYGGGRPLKYIRPADREALRAGGRSYTSWGTDETLRTKAGESVRAELASMGTPVPEGMVYREPNLANLYFDLPNPHQASVTSRLGVGKAFYDTPSPVGDTWKALGPDPSRVFDLYKFYPGAWDRPHAPVRELLGSLGGVIGRNIKNPRFVKGYLTTQGSDLEALAEKLGYRFSRPYVIDAPLNP